MTPPILVGPLLQIFFTEYLVAQKRLSLQTIASYRDTFRLLLQFVHRETGIQPVALPIDRLDADRVLAFLDGLERTATTRSGLGTCASPRSGPSFAWSLSASRRWSASPLASSLFR